MRTVRSIFCPKSSPVCVMMVWFLNVRVVNKWKGIKRVKM